MADGDVAPRRGANKKDPRAMPVGLQKPMDNAVIEFKNVSKRYFIGEYSIRTLRDDLMKLVNRFAGGRQDNKKTIWGLKNIDFTVRKGESLGLIGANGSGKTTILKLISRVTSATAGKVSVNGRVGSLIDLNAGFHPDLTGIENIYLNAAIRGMRRRQIRENLGSILEFSEIGQFKDTPIKHYSSGMRVRLGFAVAISCPSDILLIDEVLAVADINFQKRCFEKINELKEQGRTIIFVSQDTDKVKDVCSRVVYLSGGQLIKDAAASEAIQSYLACENKKTSER